MKAMAKGELEKERRKEKERRVQEQKFSLRSSWSLESSTFFPKTCWVQVIKSLGDSITNRSCALHQWLEEKIQKRSFWLVDQRMTRITFHHYTKNPTLNKEEIHSNPPLFCNRELFYCNFHPFKEICNKHILREKQKMVTSLETVSQPMRRS